MGNHPYSTEEYERLHIIFGSFGREEEIGLQRKIWYPNRKSAWHAAMVAQRCIHLDMVENIVWAMERPQAARHALRKGFVEKHFIEPVEYGIRLGESNEAKESQRPGA